jgi:hypothetical protein
VTWTTIPRWLYEHELPDDRLQEVYVTAARNEADGLARRLRELDDERLVVAAALSEALALVAEAEEALGRYRTPAGGGRATVSELRRALPTPDRRRLGRGP